MIRKLIGGALLGALLLLCSCTTRYAKPVYFDCHTDMECVTKYGGEY